MSASSFARPELHSSDAAERSDIAAALAFAIKRWKSASVCSLSAAVIAIILVLILPQRFDSEFSFSPQTPGLSEGLSRSSLASIAQGLGVGGLAGVMGAGGSGDYFVALLKSRAVSEQVLLHPVPAGLYPDHPELTNLLLIYGVDPEDFEYDLDKAVVKFQDRTTSQVDATSGVVHVTVQAPNGELAQFLGRLTLQVLQDLNSRINRLEAIQQAHFVGGQLALAQQTLMVTEDSLKDFYISNRTFSSSPELTFQEQRLKDHVGLRQSVYQLLSQQYEQAKIDAAKNLPAFGVVDSPNRPAIRAFPKRRKTVMLAAVLGALGTFAFLFLTRLAMGPASSPGDSNEVIDATSQAWAEVLSLYRRVVRRND